MTLDMGRGFFVGFTSKYLATRRSRSPDENIWKRQGDNASAWTCLRCGAAKGHDEVLGIALRGIPSSYDSKLYGLDVCIWPLDMQAAGYGDRKTMRLGEKTCVQAHAP